MLNQEQIKEVLDRVETEIEQYFGCENVDFSQIYLNYNPNKSISPNLECLIYKSYEVNVILSDIERGGTLSYAVNIGEFYGLRSLVSYGVSERISLGKRKEDIRESLEVLDEYLIWCMTDS
uniref:hypothetical protein n=1 Tax=Gemella cuniculi TaxID=150240 RepID=UPI00055971CE